MRDDLLTTPAALDRVARDLPDHPALIAEDRSLTFADLRSEARRAAAALIARGVRPGDRVAIWSPNCWHWVVAALGTHYAGGVLVPVNTAFTAAEAADILVRSRSRLLLAADSFAGTDRIAELDRAGLPSLVDVVRIPVGPADPAWSGFLDGPAAALAEVDARAAAVDPDDVADIVFTSGTTGRSKGVVCAHRQSLSAAASGAECYEGFPEDRYLCLAPFFLNFGYRAGILCTVVSGCTMIIQRAFDVEQAARLIERHRITILPGPPTLLQAILDHPGRSARDLSSLRMVATGGAPVPAALVERLIGELGVRDVVTGYGQTESSGYGTMCRTGDDPMLAATTSGRPMAGFDLRIDSPDDNGAGEILLRGPNVMLGYLDDPEATAAVIDADGWLHTGDVGTIDEAGYLHVTGRLTDMYICGGMNVYPTEVEAVLVRADGVATAAVIGVPDERLGEVGRAFLTAAPGRTVDRAEVIAYARANLAGYKIPRSVIVLDELPKSAAGKVLKRVLREIEYESADRVKPAGLGGPPIGHVENWVADAWQVLLNIERPGRRDKFTDLGGDSIAAVEFSDMLHRQFGFAISVDSLAQRPSIAAVVAGLESGEADQRRPVVTLREDGDGPFCLMLPGIGGHAWQFMSLARALTGPCDVGAVSPVDLRDDSPGGLRTRIRQAALRAIEELSPAGRPIVVAGYSFGGLIAADVAGWLPGNGVPVDRLILLDPDPLDSAAASFDPRFAIRDGVHVRFSPGSAAARRLEKEITEVAGLLQECYLDGSVRLPQIPVSWLQTPKVAGKFASAPSLFGTPVASVPKTILESSHLGLLKIPHVSEVATWMDQQLAAAD